MPWFRLEDSFYDNPKVVRAGNEAIGLWIRCATWSACHLTDGHIPVEIRQRFGRKRAADRLQTVGLWVEIGREYIIADWLEYQPSAAEVKERRSLDRINKTRGGRIRARNARRDEHGHFLPNDGPEDW